MAGTTITFNGNSLQTSGTSNIITQSIDHHGGPDIDIDIFKLAHGNRSRVTWAGYPQKKITIKGQLTADTIANTDTLIDTFKGYLTGGHMPLEIGYAGSIRRYYARASKIDVSRPGGLMYANFTVDFVCTQPFGQDTTLTSMMTAVSASTLSTRNDALTVGGSADYQYPIITYTLASFTAASSVPSVTFGNGLNGQALTVTRNWLAGDVLIIDTWNDLITVNGTEVNFTGAIPVFDKGVGQLTYADTFSARSESHTAQQYKYWL